MITIKPSYSNLPFQIPKSMNTYFSFPTTLLLLHYKDCFKCFKTNDFIFSIFIFHIFSQNHFE